MGREGKGKKGGEDREGEGRDGKGGHPLIFYCTLSSSFLEICLFRGQSRSPNIVPFHTLGKVSSCAIVTLYL